MHIPPAITGYFESDSRRDVEAIITLFTKDAVVIDDGHAWEGSADIRAWQLGPASRYEYTVTVLRIENTGGETFVAATRN
jgi:ketosteroid isomerase-like protein